MCSVVGVLKWPWLQQHGQVDHRHPPCITAAVCSAIDAVLFALLLHSDVIPRFYPIAGNGSSANKRCRWICWLPCLLPSRSQSSRGTIDHAEQYVEELMS